MTDLSPAVEAVLDAFLYKGPELEKRVAAVLRAAADECDSDWTGVTVIHHLYAIADELEQLND